jgi:hypothetical protein
MKNTIDRLVQSIAYDLRQYDPVNLAQRTREALGAGVLQAASEKRDAIQHFADDPQVPEETREYARTQLELLPAF